MQKTCYILQTAILKRKLRSQDFNWVNFDIDFWCPNRSCIHYIKCFLVSRSFLVCIECCDKKKHSSHVFLPTKPRQLIMFYSFFYTKLFIRSQSVTSAQLLRHKRVPSQQCHANCNISQITVITRNYARRDGAGGGGAWLSDKFSKSLRSSSVDTLSRTWLKSDRSLTPECHY